jgi:hypothetical protein
MRSKLQHLRWLLFAMLAAGMLNATVCWGPNGLWFSTHDFCFDDDDCDDDWIDDLDDWWDDFWDD